MTCLSFCLSQSSEFTNRVIMVTPSQLEFPPSLNALESHRSLHSALHPIPSLLLSSQPFPSYKSPYYWSSPPQPDTESEDEKILFSHFLDMVKQLLVYDLDRRLDPEQALCHAFFSNWQSIILPPLCKKKKKFTECLIISQRLGTPQNAWYCGGWETFPPISPFLPYMNAALPKKLGF